MPGLVQIRDPRRLEEFSAALGRYRQQMLQTLRSTEAGLQDAAQRLDERRNLRQREVQQWRAALEEARAAYEACQNADDDGPPDCSEEGRAVAEAKRQLAKAEDRLKTVLAYQRKLNEATERYRRQATAARELVNTRSQHAESFLKNKAADLEAYQRTVIGVVAFGAGPFLSAVKGLYKSTRNSVGSAAVRHARAQEINLVRATGRGTRDWSKSELRLLQHGGFPKGYDGHHINNVARFPDLAGNPDNIRFVTRTEHLRVHQGSFRNNSSGNMFNRKSLMKQWLKT